MHAAHDRGGLVAARPFGVEVFGVEEDIVVAAHDGQAGGDEAAEDVMDFGAEGIVDGGVGCSLEVFAKTRPVDSASGLRLQGAEIAEDVEPHFAVGAGEGFRVSVVEAGVGGAGKGGGAEAFDGGTALVEVGLGGEVERGGGDGGGRRRFALFDADAGESGSGDGFGGFGGGVRAEEGGGVGEQRGGWGEGW